MADKVKRSGTMRLPVKLTIEETINFGRALAQTVDERAAEEERQDGIKQGLKATLSDIETRHKMLATIVASGEELREVEIETEFDFDLGKVYVSRLDTGEVIINRPMTAEERQRTMFGDPK